MLKTIFLAAIATFTLATTAHAQSLYYYSPTASVSGTGYTGSYTSATAMTANESETSDGSAEANPLSPSSEFDWATGTFQIWGTDFDDECIVYTGSNGLLRVEVTSAIGTQDVRWFGPEQVSRIIFHGGGGDDDFRFWNVSQMAYYNWLFGWFDIDCELNGGDGADILSGGTGDDILIGGMDQRFDLLEGNAGADILGLSGILCLPAITVS
ncbi:hypothetical protein [Planctomycetes bacterium TBK1r]|uniref:Uncharacterized protein n=1 Tax=Stieleria magnilauensis TaxID=2527963 RepID=A0ABX5XJI4_9BACT|nr:hypothetical protein TBK1r_10790 [Planctomycetes bacterium TBK1r]